MAAKYADNGTLLPPNDYTAEIPSQLKHLRACLTCRLIKSNDQWQHSSECENCGDQDTGDITQYTTPVFHGMIAVLQPTHSWVNRFQCAGNSMLQSNKPLVQGLYAVQVTAVENPDEQEPNEYEEEL